MGIKMQPADLHAFLAREFAQVKDDFVVEAVAYGTIRIRMPVRDGNLRPGGSVSGPSMFALADVTIYLALLAIIGPKALAVTTNCSIDFMRKPVAGIDLIAEGRILKLGRALAVGDVLIRSATGPDPVARASLTYSIPPGR